MSDAPYQQIAREIRQRIRTGKLKPGDRVPSTRALIRDHGIAMATATKALTLLQQERLIHPLPGVGNVVGPPPRRTPTVSAPVEELSQESVVRVAIELADADGLPALSMRRIAAELGVSTMALYRYVGGKDALILQMVETAIGDFPFPAKRPSDWRAAIEQAARLQWAAYRRHLWLASAVTLNRPQYLPKLAMHTDAVLRAVAGLDVDASTAMYAAITVFGYVRGVALNLEPEAQAEQDTGVTADEWAALQADRLADLIRTGGLAGFQALADFDFDYDLDQLFDFGLKVLLDGLAVTLGASGRMG
ncbi:TetR/AcrR family transcriptional regulator C-terminal domain-containing protein [Kribbella sp. NPDC006257]|uniref:GntR family transcriptional regulator n=1 Tax=Kribbella sp. NPDC006257 TaxID=3156738 RepID=UPI0033A6E97E